MAIKALTLDNEWEFQSEHDPMKGKAGATVFMLGALDSRIFGKIRDMATRVHVDPNRPDDEVESSIAQSEVWWHACLFGIRGWKNFKDGSGDVKFKTTIRNVSGKSYTVVDEEILRLLPGEIVTEIAQEVMKGNTLEEEDAKKSG